jgi:hypothetical protein
MMFVYFSAEAEGFVKHVGVEMGHGMEEEEEEEGVESSQLAEAVVVAFL